MGLLDFFTKEGRMQRHIRRMSNRDTPPEDREVSAKWLVDEGSPKAILGLLSRFDMNLTQQLKDRNEKQWTYDLIKSMDGVQEPLYAWLRQCRQFQWPIRMLEELVDADAATEMGIELLGKEQDAAIFKPEKKKELLVWLFERDHAETAAAAAPYIADFDEDVRFAAAKVVIKNGATTWREPLLAQLANPEEDSNRVRGLICDTFKARNWSAAGVDLTDRLPDGYAVRDDRIVST